MTVVGQQEFDGGVRHHGGEGSLNDVNHLWLALRHVERIGKTAFEALALALDLPCHPFAVGELNGRTQLVGQLAHLVVGLPLLSIADDDQHIDEREDDGDQDARRDEIRGRARTDGSPDSNCRHGEQPEDHQAGQRADEAKALCLRHLPMPFLFGHHAKAPFRVSTQPGLRPHRQADPSYQCRMHTDVP